MRAACLIREQPHYRRDAFVQGLKSLGYKAENQPVGRPEPGDVLVIWNRYGHHHETAALYERAGARVIVAENGYLGQDPEGRQAYAMALSGHNGSGRWYVGSEGRWSALGIHLAPWRKTGDYVLICGQRGIGAPQMRSPDNWHWEVAEKLKLLTDREIVVRSHPEDRRAKGTPPPLDEQLEGAWAVVVWASSVAGKALIRGIPAFVAAPHHVLDGAVQRDMAKVHAPDYPLRRRAFNNLAWAQWSVDEIAEGLPFKFLLQALPVP